MEYQNVLPRCLKDLAVTPAFISEEKERGLVTLRDIDEGQVIFEETAWVSSQYLYNKRFFKACEHCMKSLESPTELLVRLSGVGKVQLPFEKEFEAYDHVERSISGELISCSYCQEVFYCSEKCQAESMAQYHDRMCRGRRNIEPLDRLAALWKEFHYPPETATPMLLVRAVCRVLSFLDNGMTYEQSIAPLLAFKNDVRDSSARLPSKFLDAQFSDRLDALYEAFVSAIDDPRIPGLLSRQGFNELFSLMCLNAQGFGTSSLEAYQALLSDRGDATSSAVLDSIDSLQDAIEETSGEFTRVEGSALYLFHRLLNHSCVPNARILYRENSATLSLVASTPIKSGTEVTISYAPFGSDEGEALMDSCEDSCSSDGVECGSIPDLNARRDYLKEYYQFDCRCLLCEKQSS